MKITIKNYKKDENNISIDYLVEREKQTYNNIIETVILNNSAIEGLTENEIKTFGYKLIRPTAIRVFEQIEPLDEGDTPIDFELAGSIQPDVIEKVKTETEILQEEIITLKLALVEQSEKAIQDKADLQLALAEIAENMGGV